MAGVDGRLQISSYEAQDGTKRQRAEVVADSVRFLEPKAGGQSQSQGAPKTEAQPSFSSDPFASGGKIDLSDDDLPF